MRALLPLAGLAVALVLPSATWAEDPKSTTDIRCMVVSGGLSSSDDPELQSLGRASLFYFMGRLEGRGDVTDLNGRVVEEEAKMTGEDVKTQAKICGALFNAALQNLQSTSDAIAQHVGAGAGGTMSPTPAAPAPK
jgi:hypothetical protein